MIYLPHNQKQKAVLQTAATARNEENHKKIWWFRIFVVNLQPIKNPSVDRKTKKM